jgi:uncharacterized radical SAM protein YgiQ
MWRTYCKKGIAATCPRRSCLVPEICPHLETSHKPLIKLLEKAAAVPGIKRILIASGIRFDLALRDPEYIRAIAARHTGGHLKLAPEHVCDAVLRRMNKPSFERYRQFVDLFTEASKGAGKEQYVLPYLIVGHPGEALKDSVEMMKALQKMHIQVRQVQEFTPTPMTVSTCMFFSGRDFETGKPIHVPKGREVRLMKSLVQWFLPENKDKVAEALRLVRGEKPDRQND